MTESVLRRVSRTAFGILSCSAALLLPEPAHAQSFFEQLFGSSAPARIAPRLQPRTSIAPVLNATIPMPRASAAPRQSYDPGEDQDVEESRNGILRTVCVRLCDGGFFPISNSASRGHLSRDADICRSRCSGPEARLY